MRKLLAFLILLIILIGLAPFIDGYFAKQNYLKFIDTINANTKKSKITVKSYQLGWLSSEVQQSVDATNPDNPFTITMTVRVLHGPLIYDPVSSKWFVGQYYVRSNFVLPDNINTILFGAGVTQPILQTSTLATFNNEFINTFSIPAMNIQAPNGANLTWKGLNGATQFNVKDQHFDHVQLNFTSGTLTATNGPTNFTLQNVDVQYDSYLTPFGFLNTTSSLTAPQITLTTNEGSLLLNNLNFKTQNHLDNNNNVNGQSELSFTNMSFLNFSINSADLKLGAQNLSAQGLKNYVQALQNMSSNAGSFDRNQVYGLLPQILTPTTQFTENLSVMTPQGNILSDGQVTWDGGFKSMQEAKNNTHLTVNLRVSVSLINFLLETAAKNEQAKAIALPTPPANPNTAMAKTNVKPNIPAPSRTDKIRAQIQDAVKKGYIKQDNNDYVVTITLQKGVTKINGLEAPK